MDLAVVACPTCGSRGAAPCIRGRMWSPIWARNEAMPQPHDSRITAQKRAAAVA